MSAVATGDVMRVLEPIWRTKSETASRLRGRMRQCLTMQQPTAGGPGKTRRDGEGICRSCFLRPTRSLKFSTTPRCPGPRSAEVIRARWSELDTHDAIWTVPAARMKAGRKHRVPLSDAALCTLRSVILLRREEASDWIFPGGIRGKPLSNMALIMLLRRMKRSDLTVHGFRSTFRDWAAETTGHAREVVEMSLAHSISDKVEAAYRRGDLFDKRKRLLTQ